jgi:NADP-dependent 3-hydroxy acid dehydrogenase YdfG
MNRIVFITGATSGFGEASAHIFAKNNYNLILNGRRKARLEKLGATLTSKYKIKCLLLPFDVSKRTEVCDSVQKLPPEWQNIDVLINNAGLALGRELFDNADIDDWDTMLDTNVKGLLYVSKAVLPYMIKQGNGHIINMGSVAGKEVYERGNVYCASKQAVDALSKAMRIDLLQHQIKVTAVHPGAAETEFSLVRFKGDKKAANKIYDGYKPLSAKDVAEIVFYTTTLPPHVCINDLVLTSIQQANAIYFNKQA